jgi:hypothetical protein
MTYNKTDTAYYKLAQKMESHAQPLLKQAKQDYASMKISEETGILDIGLHPEIFTYNLLKIPTAEELAKEEERRQQAAEQEKATALALQKKQLEEAHARERQERKKAAAEARATLAGQNKDGRRSTRSQQTQVAALDAIKSRPKLSSEAKRLLQTRAIELHRPEPLPTDKKVQRGYLYVSETETEEDGEDESQQEQEKGEDEDKEKEKEPEQETKEEETMSFSLTPPPSKPTERKRQLRARSQQEEQPKSKPRGRKPSAATIEARKRKARTPEQESNQDSPMPRKKARLDRKAKVHTPAAAPKQPVNPFEHGQIVWARVIGFPAHPAKVSISLNLNCSDGEWTLHVLILTFNRWSIYPRWMWKNGSWIKGTIPIKY